MEKCKLLKNENKKLISLLRDSEAAMSEKLQINKREIEKMTLIINQVWPFIQN